jgi:hypothetical protein
MIGPMLLPPSYEMTTDSARRIVAGRFGESASLNIDRVICFALDLFNGRHPLYLPCDNAFHDFDHTMGATAAVLDLLEAHASKPIIAELGARDWELTIAAILIHDAGYLKRRNDTNGSGAKYSAIHVGRSCFLAWDLLPDFGYTTDELRQIQNAISATAISAKIEDLPLRSPREWLISVLVATGDMLGQMAAEDYPERLAGLYLEFREASSFSRLDRTSFGLYTSLLELLRNSEKFFYRYVMQMLEKEWKGVYHVLDDATGANPYIIRIKKNLDRVARMARSLGDS